MSCRFCCRWTRQRKASKGWGLANRPCWTKLLTICKPSAVCLTSHSLQKKAIQRRLRDKLGRDVQTDNYEDIIASEVVDASSIDVCMEDIGGLEDTKKTLVVHQPDSHYDLSPLSCFTLAGILLSASSEFIVMTEAEL